MLKGLCIGALSVSAIVLILCLADLILGLSGLNHLAPFKYASLILDAIFIICAGILGALSWFTMKDQV